MVLATRRSKNINKRKPTKKKKQKRRNYWLKGQSLYFNVRLYGEQSCLQSFLICWAYLGDGCGVVFLRGPQLWIVSSKFQPQYEKKTNLPTKLATVSKFQFNNNIHDTRDVLCFFIDATITWVNRHNLGLVFINRLGN